MGSKTGNSGVKSKKKKQNIKLTSKPGMFIVIGCLVLLAIVVGCKAKGLREQSSSLQVQAAELQEQLDEANSEYEKLQKQQEYMKTDEYVEEVARTQLGLVYKDEIVMKPEE